MQLKMIIFKNGILSSLNSRTYKNATKTNEQLPPTDHDLSVLLFLTEFLIEKLETDDFFSFET